MRKRTATALIAATVICVFGQIGLADPPAKKKPVRDEDSKEVLVFVTGSLIPKRVKVKPVGTNTLSPVRVIDRNEIDQTGRQTTSGVLINEPSVRVRER